MREILGTDNNDMSILYEFIIEKTMNDSVPIPVADIIMVGSSGLWESRDPYVGLVEIYGYSKKAN